MDQTQFRSILVNLPLLFFFCGCSDPVVKPTIDDSCKNIIRYSLSGKPSINATHGYDDEGLLTSYVETNAEDKEIFRLSRTYDDQGRRTQQIIDTTRFEPNHREMTWEYDDADRVVRTTYDGWGSDASFFETQIGYDSQGRLSSLESKKNGEPYDLVKNVFIEGEPQVFEEQHYTGPDHTLAYGFRYFLRQRRWLERSEIFNAEIVQSAEWYTYEAQNNGRVTRRDFDPGADNIVEEIDTIVWNANGQVETTEFDLDANGQVDQRNQFTYDAQGRLSTRTWSILDQGNLVFLTTVVWSDDALQRVERIDKSTGQAIESWDFDYGCYKQRTMDVPIAPIQGFRNEMKALPFNVDAFTWWRSFDAL